MIRRPLEKTLLELVEAISPQAASGLLVTEALLDVPLEVFTGVRDGKPVLYASPPHTRWKSGVLPPVHLSRLHVQLLEPAGPERRRNGVAG